VQRPTSGGYTISVCNQPARSTQPCIPPGSINRVITAEAKAGMSLVPGGLNVVWVESNAIRVYFALLTGRARKG